MTSRRGLVRAATMVLTIGALLVSAAGQSGAAAPKPKGTAARTATGKFITGDRFNSEITITATNTLDTTGSKAVTHKTASVHLTQHWCDSSGGIDYLNQMDLQRTVTDAKGIDDKVMESGYQTASVDLDAPQIDLVGTLTRTPADKFTNCEVFNGPEVVLAYHTVADIEAKWVKDPSVAPTTTGMGTTDFTWTRPALTSELHFQAKIKDEQLADHLHNIQAQNASLMVHSVTTDGSDASKLFPIKP